MEKESEPIGKRISDYFSSLTLEECEQQFDEYVHQIKDKLSLLRFCIELLNRLENTNRNLFAGKVLIHLAKQVPLYDQSGINVRSDFNVRKLPNIESKPELQKVKEVDMQIDMEEGETLSDDDSNDTKPTHDDRDQVYERFWKIQHFLHQPNQLYDKNCWHAFRTQVDALIHMLESKKIETKVWKKQISYVTSPKAFALQLNDVSIKRCFLVQLLIILQYLEMPNESKPDNFVLDKMQLSWSSTIVRRIYGLLDTIPNQSEGRKFLGLVRHLLRREEMWSRWKDEKCKEPKKPEEGEEMINMRGTYRKRRKISNELISAKPYNMHVIGSQDMSRLWNMKPRPDQTPDLGKYLNVSAEQQEEKFKDPNNSFKILRLLRNSPHFFIATSEVIQSLDGYLKGASSRYLQSVRSD